MLRIPIRTRMHLPRIDVFPDASGDDVIRHGSTDCCAVHLLILSADFLFCPDIPPESGLPPRRPPSGGVFFLFSRLHEGLHVPQYCCVVHPTVPPAGRMLLSVRSEKLCFFPPAALPSHPYFSAGRVPASQPLSCLPLPRFAGHIPFLHCPGLSADHPGEVGNRKADACIPVVNCHDPHSFSSQ